MNTSTYKFNYLVLLFVLHFSTSYCFAQINPIDTTANRGVDTVSNRINMDAIYNRPFLSLGKSPIAIGGYLEANTQYAQTDGISDGFSFQMRRTTLFLSSTIARNIKFLSEIEFEDGTKEINIEYAAIDV